MTARTLSATTAAATLAGLLLATGHAVAQPAAPETVGASADRSSVDAIAHSVSSQCTRGLATASGDVAIVGRAELPPAAPRADALLDAILGPLTAELRSETRFIRVDRVTPQSVAGTSSSAAPTPRPAVTPDDTTSTATPARADSEADVRALLERGYEAVVTLTVTTRGNFLVVEGTVTGVGPRPWRELLVRRPARLASVFTRTRLDVQLRQYVGALPRLTEATVATRSLALPARGYLAAVTADLERDGRTELVLVTSAGVDVLRLGASRAGTPRVEPVASAAWPASDAPPTRARRLVATAIDAHDGTVLVRISESSTTFRVEATESRMTIAAAPSACDADTFPVDGACAAVVAGRDFFGRRLRGNGGAAARTAPASFYARSARQIRQPDGGALGVEAVVTPSGRLAVRTAARTTGMPGCGAALAMSDVDDDGQPELICSAATAVGEGDRLQILRLRASTGLTTVWRGPPLPGSVFVATSGDLDDDGLEELLAIEEPAPGATGGARLWVAR